MTRQEIYDTVARALMAQGAPSNNGADCRYRSWDGKKCAVGHLLSDFEYKPSMEGRGVGSIVLPEWLEPHKHLLMALQGAHDDAVQSTVTTGFCDPTKWMSKWKREMRKVARIYELDASVLL